jgi:hypothetical protein
MAGIFDKIPGGGTAQPQSAPTGLADIFGGGDSGFNPLMWIMPRTLDMIQRNKDRQIQMNILKRKYESAMKTADKLPDSSPWKDALRADPNLIDNWLASDAQERQQQYVQGQENARAALIDKRERDKLALDQKKYDVSPDLRNAQFGSNYGQQEKALEGTIQAPGAGVMGSKTLPTLAIQQMAGMPLNDAEAVQANNAAWGGPEAENKAIQDIQTQRLNVQKAQNEAMLPEMKAWVASGGDPKDTAGFSKFYSDLKSPAQLKSYNAAGGDNVWGPNGITRFILSTKAGAVNQEVVDRTVKGLAEGKIDPVVGLRNIPRADKAAIQAQALDQGLNLAQMGLEYQAAKTSVTNLNSGQQIFMRGAMETANKMFDKADELAIRLNLDALKPVNQADLWAKAQQSNIDVTQYKEALGEAKYELAQVLAKGRSTTEEDLRRVDEMIDDSLSAGGVLAATKMARFAIAARKQAMEGITSAGTGGTNKFDMPTPSTPLPSTDMPNSISSGPTATGPNGRKIVVKDGKWVDATTGEEIK